MHFIPSAVDIACELVRMDSTNPPGFERACAEYCANLLKAAGLDVRMHEFDADRTGLVATLKGNGGGDPLCFTGHLDTVPFGHAEWTYPPLGAEIHDGRLYGRGTCDMKGGVASMIHAILRLAAEKSLTRDIVLILTAGEETGCLGSQAMAADGVLPARALGLVVGEPTGNLPVLGHKGALWVHGIARGKAAHGSMPEHGDNAIVKAAKAIGLLENYFDHARSHPLLGRPTINVGMIAGGSKINMVPDKCEFEADIRSVPGVSHTDMLAGLRKHVGDLAELTDFINAEAVYTDPSDPWINLALDAIAQVTDYGVEAAYVSYFTDASALSRAMGGPPTLVLGPGEKNMAHQTDEWCSVANIEAVSEMYYRIAIISK